MTNSKKYFLSVDWCNTGKRGIFCDRNGTPFSQEEPFSTDRIWEILDIFNIILNPESLLLSEEELKEYNKWIPLAEFSYQYGIALKEVTITGKISGPPNIQSVPREAGIFKEGTNYG